MREALKEELLNYLSDDEIPVFSRWEAFTHEETEHVLDEVEMGLSLGIFSELFSTELTEYVLGIRKDDELTYEEILEMLIDYAEEDFAERAAKSSGVEDIDDLEYEIKRIILSHGYYHVSI
jgi:hypothetical protein